MTRIANRAYTDELDREFQIRKFIAKPRYSNCFKNLLTYFDDMNAKAITRMQYQSSFCVVDNIYAYQTLEGLVILGVLAKVAPGQGKTTRYIKNPLYWQIAKEEIEKNGNAGKDR